MKTAVIVQARTGSTRLPGKVLADLHGRPLLFFLLERLNMCEAVDEIIVATTDLPVDDKLANLVEDNGFIVIRGSDKDVLARYKLAAEATTANVLVRVTADCPFVDPQLLSNILEEFDRQDVDYLIIDLPPGTGDVQLTLCQKIPVSGAIIVTTPQDISLIDARKGLKMFEKVEVPVLGIVENMSTHVCKKCGHIESIFGEGGGDQLASEAGVDLIGELPLEKQIREEMDKGTPTVSSNPMDPASLVYRDIARKMTAKLSMRKKDYSSAFPKIVIQND